MSTHRRELSVATAIVASGLVLAVAAPGFFSRENLGDLLLGNLPVLLVAIGTTLVILTGEIDISVGSAFAICGVVAGVAAHAGFPIAASSWCRAASVRCSAPSTARSSPMSGMPSIVVTLATMVALRDGLRWTTQGAWVQDLPATFQWLGLSQRAYPVFVCALAAFLLAGRDAGACAAWRGSRHLRDGLER